MIYPPWIRRIRRAVATYLCIGPVDAPISASTPKAALVQEGPHASPCQDRGSVTQDPSSDMGTTVRKRPTKSSSVSSSRLSNSLYGHGLVAFVATSNYQNSSKSSQDDEPKPMKSEEDIARIRDLVAPQKNFRHALNKKFTKSNLVHNLTELRQLPGPRFYYLGGHAEWCEERGEFDYIFGRDAKGGSVNDPTRRISSKELGALLADPASPIPTQMIVITDFCNSFNFLRKLLSDTAADGLLILNFIGLPWTLRRSTDGRFSWEQSKGYMPGTWSDNHKILQFASGEKGAPAYSFESCGSIFTREFYNAEHTGEGSAKAPVSLSKRMELICDGINKFIETYNSKNSLAIRQIPQVYASHRFDLDRPSTLSGLLTF